jgi:hypothetical protein
VGAERAAHATEAEAARAALEARAFEISHYMTQPLVELYGGCMVVLKVS